MEQEQIQKLKEVLKSELDRVVPAHFGEVFSADEGDHAVEKLLDEVAHLAALQRDFTRELEAKHCKDTIEDRLRDLETKLDEISGRVSQAKNCLSHNKSKELQELVYHRSKIERTSKALQLGTATTSALNPKKLIDVEEFEQGDASRDVIVGVRTAMKMRHGAELGAIRSAHEQDSIQLQKKLRKAQGDLAELKRRQQEQLRQLQERRKAAANKKQQKEEITMQAINGRKGGEPSHFRMDLPGSDRGICSPPNEDEDDNEEEKAILQAAGKQVDRATKEQKWGWNFVEQMSKNSFPSKQKRWNGCTTKARRLYNGERYMDAHLLGADYKSVTFPVGSRTGTQQTQLELAKLAASSSDAMAVSQQTQLPDAMAQTWHPSNDAAQPSGINPNGKEIPLDNASKQPREEAPLGSTSATHPESPGSVALPRLPGASPPDSQSPSEPMSALHGLASQSASERPDTTTGSIRRGGSPTDEEYADDFSPEGEGPAAAQPAAHDGDNLGSTMSSGGDRSKAKPAPAPLGARSKPEDLHRVGSPPRSRKLRQRLNGQPTDIHALRKNLAALHGQIALPPAIEAYATPRMLRNI